MVGAHIVIPHDALLIAAHGPCPGDVVEAGTQLAMVDRAGSICLTEVRRVIDEGSQVPIRRLLTRFGDAVVTAEAKLIGSRGVVPASDLVDGDSTTLEMVAPGDMPRVVNERRQPLEGIEETTFAIPRENGTAEVVAGHLEQVLRQLKLRWETTETERWLRFRLDKSPTTDISWTWSDELALMRSLCGWETEEGEVVTTRARMDQPSLRQRLLAAHIATCEPFSVSWVPGYHPVECRVTIGDRPVPAYVKVLRVLDEIGSARTIEITDPGSLITSTLLLHADKGASRRSLRPARPASRPRGGLG